MRKFIIILLSLVGIVVLGGFAFLFYLKSTLTPTYEGELSIQGLQSPTDVYYTDHGIPHIYATNAEDAYRAFGYVHAQDRLWQMDLLRHVGSGRLSELFGADLIESDKYLRTMGIASYAKESAEAFISRKHESLPLIEAYLEGINQYIATNSAPLEHLALGIKPEPFTVQNIFETITYMAFSFQNAQKTDPVLTELAAKLDSTYLEDLKIYHYEGETMIPSFDDRYSALAVQTSKTLRTLQVPAFIGSNSWVLSGDKTESGKVILENDPHIGFASPSVWYEAHINYPGIEYYGYHIAGIPFPLLVHNTKLANGITMFENDDMDFYIEEINAQDSNVYRHGEEWKTMSIQKEIINVMDADPVEFEIRHTAHGPIVSDILSEDPLEEVVSMYWVTSNFANYTMESVFEFSVAASLEDIEQAASKIHGPGLNIMYGDSAGNIAWWASAKLPLRADELSSKTFYEGPEKVIDPTAFYPFSKNPHAINPPSGYVYSANNQPDTVDGVVYAGYYLPDDRGERIVQLLEAQDEWTVEQVKEMTLDHYAVGLSSIKETLLDAVEGNIEDELFQHLSSWNGQFAAESSNPLIYQQWSFEVMKQAMQDEMGEKLWKGYLGSHTYKTSIEQLVRNGSSKWWDNVETNEVETRSSIIKAALDSTLTLLKTHWGDDYTNWRWSEAHQLTHNHAMGTALSFLNIGPFSIHGGNEVLNNMGYEASDEKILPVTFGPSTRRIINFSDVRNNSWSILPTGQSGNFFSPFYADQSEMYISGEFRKMMMNHDEIKRSEMKLTLK